MHGRAVGATAVLVAALVVVLAAAVEGPARIRPIGAPAQTVVPGTPPPQPELSPVGPQHAAPGQLPWLAPALTVVIVVAAVAMVVLLLLRLLARRRRLRAASTTALLAGVVVDAADETAAAPVVRRGIAAALAVLDEDREPRDAVVRAWIGLQQSAEDAGVRRHPAETPTEFSTRVLTRTAAAAEPVRALLGLYRRARFGHAPIGPEDVDRARTALLAVQASWAAEQVAG